MAKRVIVRIGYMKYVLDADAGLDWFTRLTQAGGMEKVENEWDSKNKRTMLWVEPADPVTLEAIPDEDYALMKIVASNKEAERQAKIDAETNAT